MGSASNRTHARWKPSATREEQATEASRALLRIFPYVIGVSDAAVRDRSVVSIQRGKALFALAARSMRGTDIARQWHLSRAAVAEVLAVLEEDGLVRRAPDPLDKRSICFRITRTGLRELERLDTAVTSALAAVVAQLTPDQQRHLRNVCLALQRLFAREPPRRGRAEEPTSR